MLTVEHVGKGFGSVTAVADVSLTIPTGSTFGLIGPNGAGKTTMMRMILGILTPDSGSIQWNGKAIHAKSRRQFGYLPEERGLYAKMKVGEQIAYFGKLHGIREPVLSKHTDEWIERLGLREYALRPCSELSKGNQQKVQMACAAIHAPSLLVLDEPFSGLDPVNAEILIGILNELKSAGATLVLSSHQMWQLEELCTDVCIIARGRDRAAGKLDVLRSAWPTRIVRVSPPTPAVRQVLDRVAGAAYTASSNGTVDYTIPTQTDFSEILRSLIAVDAVTRFEAMEPSLNDIYLHSIGAAA